MGSARDSAALPALGCPIRESAGQRLFNASPRLIAVVHALLRLLVPRHPPCALPILTVIKRRTPVAHRHTGPLAGLPGALRPPSVVFPWLWLCGFQGPRRVAGRGLRPSRGLSKLSSAPAAHEARRQARSTFLGPGRIPGAAGFPTAIPRKEVIQPHLPVRLPCYDFTPVTGPTFDGSLPNGLGHRLRVLPTSVV
jgi:hypothetical protein